MTLQLVWMGCHSHLKRAYFKCNKMAVLIPLISEHVQIAVRITDFFHSVCNVYGEKSLLTTTLLKTTCYPHLVWRVFDIFSQCKPPGK